MSSGIQTNFDQARGAIEAVGDIITRVQNLGMSPRQRELDRLWAFYTACQYDARESEWDGSKRIEPLDKEVIAHRGYIPPGFYDFGASLPLKFRRPSAPYHLARTVVHRFTGMLFSERRHPQFKVEGDPDTQDAAHAIAEVCRLWPTFITARNLGGAMGSVAIGFRFVDGKPRLQIHDPRWSTPYFLDRETMELEGLEKMWMFPVDKMDAAGHWIQQWFWSRRLITQKEDVVYKPQLVDPDGVMPNWEEVDSKVVQHNFGFCPVRWIQNISVHDQVDGEPDCHGGFEMLDDIDCLIAQSNRGILKNCDPTLFIKSEMALAEVNKGSDSAIKLPGAGDNASYLEITGAGSKIAMEQVDKLRKYFLEMVECVLDHPDQTVKTATEINRMYSAMLGKADKFREQYGEQGIKPLMEMIVRAGKQLGQGSVDDTGTTVRSPVKLPPRMVNGAKMEHKFGEGVDVQLRWPQYFDPSLDDITTATDAAGKAKLTGLIDNEHATGFVAEYFHVEDVPAMVKKIAQEQKQAKQDQAGDMLNSLNQRPLREDQKES